MQEQPGLEEPHMGMGQGVPEHPRASLSHVLPPEPSQQPRATTHCRVGPSATRHHPSVGPGTPDQVKPGLTVWLWDTPGETGLSPGLSVT